MAAPRLDPPERHIPSTRLVAARPAYRLSRIVHEYRGYFDAAPAVRVQREPASSVVPLILEFSAGWLVASPSSGSNSRSTAVMPIRRIWYARYTAWQV